MELLSTLFTFVLLCTISSAVPFNREPAFIITTPCSTTSMTTTTSSCSESGSFTTSQPDGSTTISSTAISESTITITALPTTISGSTTTISASTTTISASSSTSSEGLITSTATGIPTSTSSTSTTTSAALQPTACPTSSEDICGTREGECTSVGGRVYDVQCGVAVLGTEIVIEDGTQLISSFGECQASCDAANCEGLNYSEAGTLPTCEIYSEVTGTSPNAGIISALVVSSDPDTPTLSTSLPGTTTSSSTTASSTGGSSTMISQTTGSSTTISQITSASTTLSSTTQSVTTSPSITVSQTTSTTSSGCDPTPTQGAGKRGLAYNFSPATLLFSTTCPATQGSSKVTWAYNWYSRTHDDTKLGQPRGPLHPELQFVPMLWSAAPDLTAVWATNVASAQAQGWNEVLAFNEPDLCLEGAGASCMPIDEAVAAYREHLSPLHDQGFRVGAPAVTNGQGFELGNDWLFKFIQRCTDCNIDFIPIHWYGPATNIQGFFDHLYGTFATFNKPIWITEFGVTDGTEAQILEFMRVVFAQLDRDPIVEKYSWFMTGRPGVLPGNLVSSDDQSLSIFGQFYDKS